MFNKCNYISYISDTFNGSNITNAQHMFSEIDFGVGVRTFNIVTMDADKLTDISYMFHVNGTPSTEKNIIIIATGKMFNKLNDDELSYYHNDDGVTIPNDDDTYTVQCRFDGTSLYGTLA